MQIVCGEMYKFKLVYIDIEREKQVGDSTKFKFSLMNKIDDWQ